MAEHKRKYFVPYWFRGPTFYYLITGLWAKEKINKNGKVIKRFFKSGSLRPRAWEHLFRFSDSTTRFIIVPALKAHYKKCIREGRNPPTHIMLLCQEKPELYKNLHKVKKSFDELDEIEKMLSHLDLKNIP